MSQSGMGTGRVLITGGAGFIGSHVADLLLDAGHGVTVLDALVPQVHGDEPAWPAYLDSRVRRVKGAVGDRSALQEALEDVTAVAHLAAAVGIGQSMYDIQRYVQDNCADTAALLEFLTGTCRDRVRKLVIASSMTVYGEGQYWCERCGDVCPPLRPEQQLRERVWEMHCLHCGRAVEPVPTSEAKPLMPTSVYAVTKRDQEELALMVGRAYGLPTVALRYFNTYGPRQALSNPYAGVGAVFSTRLLDEKQPLVFEDGKQSRDFIHVRDTARATIMALESDDSTYYKAFNIGTGKPATVLGLARQLAKTLGKQIEPQVVERFRQGDTRHCYADTGLARDLLGFEAQIPLEEGIADLADWVRDQSAEDRVDAAVEQLDRHGLTL